jgi:hypothetical protein
MKRLLLLIVFYSVANSNLSSVFAQNDTNCFLKDFAVKEAAIPPYEDYLRPTSVPTAILTIDFTDTVSQVSKYIFGNAVAVWVSPNVNNPTLIGYLKKLSPTMVRFPGGSWSDYYFWNGNPGDLPSTVPDGANNGNLVTFYPQYGSSHMPTFSNYLNLREQIGAQGLITVNYAYARYGLSEKPAEQAAHLAANWVRNDNGHTKFWEIGNESSGPWEVGWQINTSLNKDGQPEIINGDIYSTHFKIFADSMRKAAAEVGAEIYIGAQIIQYDGTNSWNVADRGWNQSIFTKVGDTADFYVIHNYFGSSSTTPKSYLDGALTSIRDMSTFIRQDMQNNGAAFRPIALTEWNTNAGDNVKTSIVNGIQGVLSFSEMAKLGYGMSCRWLIANWEGDGMFYHGNNPAIPEWNPRPDYYFITYLQRYFGSYMLGSSITGSTDILAYPTLFNSGQIGIILVNTGENNQTVKIDLQNTGYGNRYYYYSLTGGNDDAGFSKYVSINGVAPEATRWGPLEKIDSINALSDTLAYPVKINSPGSSVQYVLLETGAGLFTQVDVDSFYITTADDITSIDEDNGTIQFSSHFLPENVTNNNVVYTLSDSTVAKIDANGLLTALNNGQETVTGTSEEGQKTSQVIITITNQKHEVTGLSLRTATGNKTIKTKGGTLQMIADVVPEDAEDKNVLWEVNNEIKASISEDGLLTAKNDGIVSVKCTTHDGGYTASISITITNQTTGINDYSLNNLLIYPGPAAEELTIENDFPIVQYHIMNIEGKLLKAERININQTTIDISNLKKGIYLIQVQTESGIKVEKFVK